MIKPIIIGGTGAHAAKSRMRAAARNMPLNSWFEDHAGAVLFEELFP